MTMPHQRRLFAALGATVVAPALLLTLACSSARSPHPKPEPEPEPEPGRASLPPPPLHLPAPQSPPRQPGRRGPQTPATADQIVAKAHSMVGRPYRYGGASPAGFDCSGFTAFVFSSAGIEIPRTTAQQATIGHWVAADELATGDLVFFGTDRNSPFHVGLVVSGPGQPLTMIHASTSRGVIETEVLSDSYWLPRLKFGRRAISLQ